MVREARGSEAVIPEVEGTAESRPLRPLAGKAVVPDSGHLVGVVLAATGGGEQTFAAENCNAEVIDIPAVAARLECPVLCSKLRRRLTACSFNEPWS